MTVSDAGPNFDEAADTERVRAIAAVPAAPAGSRLLSSRRALKLTVRRAAL